MTGIDVDGGRVTGVQTVARADPRGEGRARRRRAHLRARRDGRAAAAGPVAPAAGARLRAARAGPAVRGHVQRRARLRLARRTRASWSWAPASTPTTATPSAARSTSSRHQMAAALELFPLFAQAHVLRTWGGIVDMTPDASPIVGPDAGRRAVRQLRLGHGRVQGHAGLGLDLRAHDRPRRAARAERAVRARALRDRRADRRARRRRGGALAMLLDPLPLLRPARRDRVPLRRAGARPLPRRPGRARRRGLGASTCSCATTRRARARERWSHTRRLPALVQRGPRHGDARGDRVLRGRGAAAVSAGSAGGSRIDRDAPVRFTFDGRRARPACAATRSPRRCWRTASASSGAASTTGARAGSWAVGPEEPSALVQVTRDGDLGADAARDRGRAVDGLARRVARRPRAARARRRSRRTTTSATRTATCWSSAAARPGCRGGRRGARPPRRRAARDPAPSATPAAAPAPRSRRAAPSSRRCSTRTRGSSAPTTHGYVVRRRRRRGAAVARPRAARRARDRRRRAARSSSRATTGPGVMLAGAAARVRGALRRSRPARPRRRLHRPTTAGTRPRPALARPASRSPRSSTPRDGAVVCGTRGRRRR